jgi:selenoprotein W-related protein
LTAELLNAHEPEVESISLVPSKGGRFEVSIDNHLIYSKLKAGRHAEPGEVAGLLENYLKEHS